MQSNNNLYHKKTCPGIRMNRNRVSHKKPALWSSNSQCNSQNAVEAAHGLNTAKMEKEEPGKNSFLPSFSKLVSLFEKIKRRNG